MMQAVGVDSHKVYSRVLQKPVAVGLFANDETIHEVLQVSGHGKSFSLLIIAREI